MKRTCETCYHDDFEAVCRLGLPPPHGVCVEWRDPTAITKAKIYLTHARHESYVELDGQRIQGITSVEIKAKARGVPCVRLDIMAEVKIEIEGMDVALSIKDLIRGRVEQSGLCDGCDARSMVNEDGLCLECAAARVGRDQDAVEGE